MVRTHFFDDFLLYAAWSAGVRQVVLLAAGMDTRAFRLSWPSVTRLYELDRPEVLTTKEEILAQTGASPACQRRLIGADLRHLSWSEALLRVGYEPQESSVWLMEGLLFYMHQTAVGNPLGVVGTLAPLPTASWALTSSIKIL